MVLNNKASNGVMSMALRWISSQAGRVEVLRGAASLQYGSDALGGVINVLTRQLPAEGNIKGEFLDKLFYQQRLKQYIGYAKR
jgi:outer membrane receptor for ferrienterochelin and colicin